MTATTTGLAASYNPLLTEEGKLLFQKLDNCTNQCNGTIMKKPWGVTNCEADMQDKLMDYIAEPIKKSIIILSIIVALKIYCFDLVHRKHPLVYASSYEGDNVDETKRVIHDELLLGKVPIRRHKHAMVRSPIHALLWSSSFFPLYLAILIIGFLSEIFIKHGWSYHENEVRMFAVAVSLVVLISSLQRGLSHIMVSSLRWNTIWKKLKTNQRSKISARYNCFAYVYAGVMVLWCSVLELHLYDIFMTSLNAGVVFRNSFGSFFTG